MKIRYYHKKKATKAAYNANPGEFLAKRKEARIVQADNNMNKFEARLRRLGVN